MTIITTVKLGNYDAIDLMAPRPLAYVDVDGVTLLPVHAAQGLPVTIVTGGLPQYTEDAPAAANPIGPMMMAVRRDALTAAEVSTDGDNVAVKATSKGEVCTNDAAANAVLGTTGGAAVITDAAGTIQQYLRGIIVRILSFIGPQTAAASLSVVPSADQNPIFDNANGTKTSVTASATIITPPAGCTFVRIDTDADIVINTANATAVDDGTATRICANQPEIVPVTPAIAVKALSLAGTAVVRCTPLKVR
jgi:hypothetical protein